MTHDPIVEDVHRVRQEIMARFDNDLSAYVEYLQHRTEEARQAGHSVLPSPPPLHSDTAKKAG